MRGKKRQQRNFLKTTVTLFTFSTLQLHTGSIRDVVGGVTLEAVAGAGAEPTVVRARLAAPLLGVVEGLGAGVQTPTFKQVTLHSKLVWRRKPQITA